MNVRATVERLGREHVGKSWWADLAEALVTEFEPVVAERDRWKDRAEHVEAWLECELCDHNVWHQDDTRDDECGHDAEFGAMCTFLVCGRCYNARAALDRGTP